MWSSFHSKKFNTCRELGDVGIQGGPAPWMLMQLKYDPRNKFFRPGLPSEVVFILNSWIPAENVSLLQTRLSLKTSLRLYLLLTDQKFFTFFSQKIKCTTTPVHHMKGQSNPSTYGKKGGVKKDSNHKTPCRTENCLKLSICDLVFKKYFVEANFCSIKPILVYGVSLFIVAPKTHVTWRRKSFASFHIIVWIWTRMHNSS